MTDFREMINRHFFQKWWSKWQESHTDASAEDAALAAWSAGCQFMRWGLSRTRPPWETIK